MPKKNIAQQRFGRLVALRPTNKRQGKKTVWECACDCGEFVNVRIDSLTTGNTSSCGCLAKEISRESALRLTRKQVGKDHPRFIDMSGEVYGRLTVVEYLPLKKKWLCRCSCGNVHAVGRDHLVACKSRSCGCLDMERMCGPNNHRWNSTLTDEQRKENRCTEKYRNFVIKIFERDNFRCRICMKPSTINIHHLYNYAQYTERRFDENNSITLCETHHKEFHSWMGGTIYPCTADDFCLWLKETNEAI